MLGNGTDKFLNILTLFYSKNIYNKNCLQNLHHIALIVAQTEPVEWYKLVTDSKISIDLRIFPSTFNKIM